MELSVPGTACTLAPFAPTQQVREHMVQPFSLTWVIFPVTFERADGMQLAEALEVELSQSAAGRLAIRDKAKVRVLRVDALKHTL